MAIKQRKRAQKKTRPLAVGTGLVALDIVVSKVSDAPVRYWAGGTCANVLTILSYLGWHAKPVARLGDDKAANAILDDLKKWKVNCSFIRQEADVHTPIIVERIRKDSAGVPRHSFSWRCASCGYPFPGYRPELVTTADALVHKIRSPKAFFFDRVSAASLILAKSCSDSGGLVVFEPSGIGNPIQFRQAWEVAHVIKYSHERLAELPEMEVSSSPRLHIETLGDAGLRYRRRNAKNQLSAWHQLKSFFVKELRDTAGAGDWFTAALISKVGHGGLDTFLKQSDESLHSAFRYAQAVAAWSCQFEGARGGMYAITRRRFSEQVAAILLGEDASAHLSMNAKESVLEMDGLCMACDGSKSSKPKKPHRRRA